MPLTKCRAARAFSTPSLRSSALSIAAYRSSSSHADTPRTWPRELVAVSARNPRAVASFDADAITWATSIAITTKRR